MGEVEGGPEPREDERKPGGGGRDKEAAAEEEEEEEEDMEVSDAEGGDDDDDDDYEYTYADDEDGDGEGGGDMQRANSRPTSNVVFTGLDTIGCTNDMVLKKELMRIKADVEKSGKWQIDLAWTEEVRTLGVCLHHEGFTKANLNLTFPKSYPNEPPKFAYLGPRFDDTVDFVLGADTFEPTKKENWNDTFTCTHLLMIVMELVKDKYPITDDLVFDEYEQTLIQICRSRLPGIPKKVKEGMVYFGVRMEPKEKGSKRSSGVGYSNGGRDSHDFSVHDAKFKEQVESMRRLLEMSSKDATTVMLARVSHIKFASWLLQYLEEELPIFKFEEVCDVVRSLVDLVLRVERDSSPAEIERIQEVFREREELIRPADGKLLASMTDRVLAVADEFETHQYKADGSITPSMVVVKRIMLELEHLKDFLRTMTDGQVYVVFSEASCLLWKVLMIPSSGTPYYGGCFEFHLSIPADYPAHPPKCLFMTTGGNQVRFNPNLYNNGKVCLSLLGTWNGEPWDPQHSNLSQLLLSILAFIFTTEPLRNEPGLEGTGERSVNFYNAYIRLESLETAMLGMLAKPPSEFKDVIRRHFKQHWASLIRPDLVSWAESHKLEAETEASTHSSGQITRMSWFRTAIGPGNYKKAMMTLIAKMDEVVGGIREFDALPAPPGGEKAAMRGGAARAAGGEASGASSLMKGGGGEGGSSSSSGGVAAAGGPAASGGSSSGSSSSSSGNSSSNSST